MKTRLLIMLTCLFATGSVFAAPADSDCFEAHDGVGCDDAVCEAIVAAIDPFCVDVAWDGICADEAADLCEVDSVIDIKPGSDPNSINTKACKGVIPVALLGSDELDVSTVDPDDLAFGPDGAGFVHKDVHYEDVDEDGYTDLVAHFACSETGIASGDTEACLTYGEEEVPLSETDSDCFEAHDGVGCDDAECSAIVVAADPFCGDVLWDGICAAEAADLCGGVLVTVPLTGCDDIKTTPVAD